MAEENDSASKTEEPSAHKLSEARKKGQVAKSADLTSFASLAGAFGVLSISGVWFSNSLVAQLRPFIANADSIMLGGEGGRQVASHAVASVLPPLLAVMIGATLAGAGATLLQTGLIFSASPLAPKFDKVSPIAGFGRMFGPEGLMNFVRSLLKLAATVGVGWYILAPEASRFENLAAVDLLSMLTFSVDLVKRLMIGVLVLLGLVGGFDFLWQRFQFTNKMRMSREELKEEFKQQDGDPHVKGRQKQLRMEQARRRMMQSVPEATVIVMNPTHYAVALKYEEGQSAAPTCVAKGLDELALRIRAVAEDAGVPIIEDPPLARALYASVEIDDQIPHQHFEAVAKVIGFILSESERRKGRKKRRQ